MPPSTRSGWSRSSCSAWPARGEAVTAFPTDPWFREFVDRINDSREYREAAATWEGDIAFVIEAEPDRGLAADVWGHLDLWHGTCRGGGVVDAERGSEARYVIRAPYSRWKDVLRG